MITVRKAVGLGALTFFVLVVLLLAVLIGIGGRPMPDPPPGASRYRPLRIFYVDGRSLWLDKATGNIGDLKWDRAGRRLYLQPVPPEDYQGLLPSKTLKEELAAYIAALDARHPVISPFED